MAKPKAGGTENPTPDQIIASTIEENAEYLPSEIRLGRVGHYCTPAGAGYVCQSATIAFVHDAACVNLGVIDHAGHYQSRTSVVTRRAPLPNAESFHLNLDCPWGR
ncbi:MAG TPA: hypothetical protein VIV06_00385 [Candidatus Limnocylindrales bacterium]